MDISKINVDSTSYDVKDAVARQLIEELLQSQGGGNNPGTGGDDPGTGGNDPVVEDDDWYGIEWTSENATPVRIGNANLHRTLPVQSKMKRCTVNDDGTVHGYISDSDWTKYTDGTFVDYTGAHGQVMVEIPAYRFEATSETEDGVTTYRLKIHTTLNENYGTLSPKVYVGAFEAMSDDADSTVQDKKLYSISMTNFTISNGIVNSASGFSYLSNAAKYRGGAQDAVTTTTDDNTIKSNLGRPITKINRAGFRTRAAQRGAGWSQQYWTAYMAVIRLYVVEYCNFNSQDTYYSSDDSDGYKRGGLGDGASFLSANSNWYSFNYSNPFIPCGITKTLANSTGVIGCSYAAGTVVKNNITLYVPSYRGIENPFAHINKFTDGINIYEDGGYLTVYTNTNVSSFADDTSDGYVTKAYYIKPSNGYIKKFDWSSYGEFIPTETGGSENTYFCDQGTFSSGWRVLGSGGYAGFGARCGWFCFDANYGSGYADRSIGGRLYYTPNN